jgi:hypothetical protein
MCVDFDKSSPVFPSDPDYALFGVTKKDCGKYGWLDAVICQWPGIKEPIVVELLA